MISRKASAVTPVSKRSASSGFKANVGMRLTEIGVAAALAETIQRALHLPHAGADGGERIGDRVAGVVVGMDAETCRQE